MWRCKCKCGNETIVSATHLKTGHTFPCECLKRSKGELLISQILEENNIKYINDKGYFKDLESLNGKLRFDFILFNENNEPYYLIEFDGEQHFIPKERFGGVEQFKKQKYYDRIKDIYAAMNDLPLARIPFYDIKKLSLKLIFDEKYRVKIEPKALCPSNDGRYMAATAPIWDEDIKKWSSFAMCPCGWSSKKVYANTKEKAMRNAILQAMLRYNPHLGE